MLVIDGETLRRMFRDGMVNTIPDVLNIFDNMLHAVRNEHWDEICGRWWGIVIRIGPRPEFTHLVLWDGEKRLYPILWERIKDDELDPNDDEVDPILWERID